MPDSFSHIPALLHPCKFFSSFCGSDFPIRKSVADIKIVTCNSANSPHQVRMDQRRVVLALVAFVQVILAFRMFTNANAQFQQLEFNRYSRHGCKKRRREGDDLALVTVGASICSQKRMRRIWVYARSSHWITRVLDGMLLRESQFDKAFRMSRNSFDVLHGLLGISVEVCKE